MNGTYAFFSGLAITTGMVIAALVYLHANLRTVLTELCGTAERARFWTTFSNITLFLAPLIFALHARPEDGTPSVLVYEASGQIASALLGLLVAIAVLGLVLSRFIPRGYRQAVPAQDARSQASQVG